MNDVISKNMVVGSTGYCVLRCNDANDFRYVFYFCKSKGFISSLVKVAKGASYPAVSNSAVKNCKIPLPPLKVQRKIAETLDAANELLAMRKNQLAELDKLVKSQFEEVFGANGKEVNLVDYVWFQEGPGVRTIDFTSEGTVLLTGSNINDNEITFGYKSDRYISNELARGKYSHFICDKDDIIVVSSAINPERFDEKVTVIKEGQKYCLNTGIIRFKPNLEYLTLGYFREFLKTNYFKYQVVNKMQGIAQMHFGPTHLKTMKMLLPDSIDLQLEFDAFVKKVDLTKVKVQKAIDETQALFDSLMNEYFE